MLAFDLVRVISQTCGFLKFPLKFSMFFIRCLLIAKNMSGSKMHSCQINYAFNYIWHCLENLGLMATSYGWFNFTLPRKMTSYTARSYNSCLEKNWILKNSNCLNLVVCKGIFSLIIKKIQGTIKSFVRRVLFHISFEWPKTNIHLWKIEL